MTLPEEEPLLHGSAFNVLPPTAPAANGHSHPFGKVPSRIEEDAVPETATVGRTLGWTSAYVLVISRVIGSGIFAMPGIILQDVGSPGLALTLWIVGAGIAGAGLAVELEYGCMLPRSGGGKVYLEYTYRRPRFLASTLVAVQAVLLGFTANNCVVFAKYSLFAAGWDRASTDARTKEVAVGLLTAITIMHGCFYKTGIRIQNALGWLKIALVVFMIVTGLAVAIIRPETGRMPPPTRVPDIWKDSEWSWNNMSTALFKIFYSYAGLNNLNNVLNEVKNPVRTLKTVGSLALLTACIMYLLMNVAYLVIVPVEEIKQSRELIAALFFSRIFPSQFGNIFLPLAIALSAAGNVMVVTFSLARLNQEVARQGFLPYASLLASTAPFGAPLGALIVHYIPSLLVIVLPPADSVYAFIAEMEGYANQFFALALAIGLILLRYRRSDLKRPFRAWWAAIAFRVVTCTALIAAPLFPPRLKGGEDSPKGSIPYALYAVVGIMIIAFGIFYWYIWTQLLPRLRGYRLEEQEDVLNDGTVVTRLVRKQE